MVNDRRQRYGLASTPAARRAFTLVELLVVMAITALLLSIMLPSLAAARERARASLCASNVRQLLLANYMYGSDNNDRACPGAARFLENLHRWHGTRDTSSSAFDPARGPLVRYLGPEGAIRRCPTFGGYVTDPNQAFELGNGGYGYNNAFIGTLLRPLGGGHYAVKSDETGVSWSRVRNPAETLVFADSAFAPTDLIEYSFAEPRYMPTNGFRADPSIHFRHRARANVAWADGHVDARDLSFTWSSGYLPGDPGHHNVGWFGAGDDNRFFDLR